MIASPCGRVVAYAPVIGAELALGMDLTLETTGREIDQVRAVLRRAIDGLMAEFGEKAVHEAVVALQFQDLSEQLLASAARRIARVRSALGLRPGDFPDEPASPVRACEPEYFDRSKS